MGKGMTGQKEEKKTSKVVPANPTSIPVTLEIAITMNAAIANFVYSLSQQAIY